MKSNPPSLGEFNQVWLICLEAMELIVSQEGYDALTFPNIALRTGIPEASLILYFKDESLLRDMYDQFIILHQSAKILLGGEQPS